MSDIAMFIPCALEHDEKRHTGYHLKLSSIVLRFKNNCSVEQHEKGLF
jgi:hypothetical protein